MLMVKPHIFKAYLGVLNLEIKKVYILKDR